MVAFGKFDRVPQTESRLLTETIQSGSPRPMSITLRFGTAPRMPIFSSWLMPFYRHG